MIPLLTSGCSRNSHSLSFFSWLCFTILSFLRSRCPSLPLSLFLSLHAVPFILSLLRDDWNFSSGWEGHFNFVLFPCSLHFHSRPPCLHALPPLPPLLTLCTGFFGIPLVCASQGKATLSWDTPNYLCLSLSHSHTHTHTLFSSSQCMWGSFCTVACRTLFSNL